MLLNHNLDRRLKRYLTDYNVATTQEQGWSDVLNGELLTLAESNGFNVLLTADSNIKNQQNFAVRRNAILVLRSFNNRRTTHAEMIGEIFRALSGIRPGELLEVFHQSITGSDAKNKL